MTLVSLLLAALCLAAPVSKKKVTAPKAAAQAQEIWSVDYTGEKPVAAFFDAASGAVYVSVNEGNGRARLDRVSLKGEVEKRGMATMSPGKAGPIRAYDGKLYWVAGYRAVQIVDPKGARSSVQGVPEGGEISEIAVDGKGAVYLLMGDSEVQRVANLETFQLVHAASTAKIRGMFLQLNQLVFASEIGLFGVEVKGAGTPGPIVPLGKYCDGCRYLERTSSGAWLTTRKNEVLVDGKPVLTLKAEEIGHPAYVFRMDTAEDFFVLPLPVEGKLRAYRMPVGESVTKKDKEKPKKSEK